MSFQPLQSNPVASNLDHLPVSPPRVLATTVSDGSRRRLIWALVLFFAAGLGAILATNASGQEYDSFPMHEKLKDEKVVKMVQNAAKNFATSGAGNQNTVNAYFGYYVPAKMTEMPDGVKNITPVIKEVTDLLGRAQRSNRPQVAAQIMKFTFDGMKKVAEGNYHPAARINALLVLSRMDSQPANNSNRTPPVPLAQTRPILLAQYQNVDNPDGVRAAALQGLHRHVMYGFRTIPEAEQTTLRTAMDELLQAEPPAGRSSQAHAYLQRFAVDILEMLQPANDKTLGAKLISISTQPNSPDLIALYSASRIASMGAELKGQVATPEDVLKNWSMRALAAFESELARFKAFERPKPDKSQPKKPEDQLGKKTEKPVRSAMGSGMDGYEDDMMSGMDQYDMEDMMGDMGDYDMDSMMGGYGMGMGRVPEAKPQPPEVLASRRKLNHVLQQLHLGVTGAAEKGVPARNPGGLLASVAEDKKPVVNEWIAAMESIVTAINDPMRDDEKKYLETLVGQTAALREFLGMEEQVDMTGVPAAMAAMATAAPAAEAEAPVADVFGPAAADELAPAAAGDELAAP